MNEDFLAGVFAVQLGYASPAQVMAAASAWLADRSQSIVDRLEAEGALDDKKRALLDSFVAEALKLHDGDVKQALQTMGGEQALFRSFGGSVVLGEQGELRAEQSAEAEAAPESVGESTAVTLEQPGRYAPRGGSVDKAEIGRGGLGRILVAFDEHLGREVAIKELLSDGDGSGATPGGDVRTRTSALAARFLREARVTGQLEHPNIVPVHEVGQRQDGTFYYAMRIVRGSTLGAKLEQSKSLEERLGLLSHYIDVCNAIAYAHSRGVVHRDIKPDNVMIGEFGETVVLDWGLAKVHGKKDIRGREIEREVALLHEAGAGHTIEGSAIGTPAYMSPEQADGRIDEIDERSDVWGLGAVLYEVLTGRPPYEGATPFEILGKVLKEKAEPVRSVCAEAPPELAAVTKKALTLDPEGRYPSAKELAQEVDAFLQGQRVRAYTYSSWELLRRFVAANKALSAAAAVALVVLLVSSMLIWLAYGREQEARAAAEQQHQHAIEQQRVATVNLAQAYVSGAEHMLRKRNYGEAFLYSAAALQAYQRAGCPLSEDQRVALESVLYESRVRRALTLERRLPGSSGELHAIVFSPDGQLLATTGARGELWLQRVDGSGPPVKRVASIVGAHLSFARDGKTLLVGEIDGVLRTHALDDLRELETEKLLSKTTPIWALSPDQRRVVVAEYNGTTRLRSREDPETVIPLGPATSASFSPDGSTIARCTATGTVVIHDGITGDELATISVSDQAVGSCQYSPDGKRVLVTATGGPRVVDMATRKVVAHLTRDHFGTRYPVPTRDGRWWVLGQQTGALLWHGRGPNPAEILWRSTKPVHVAVSPDGTRVALAEPGAVRIWRWRQSERAVLVPVDGLGIHADFSPDGRQVAFSDSFGAVRVAEVAKLPAASLLTKHPPSYGTDVGFLPDGKRIATVGHDQVVKLFDAHERTELRSRRLSRLEWYGGKSSSLEVAADGSLLFVTAPDGRVHALRADTLEMERVLAANLAWPPCLERSADGTSLLAGDHFGQVAIWNTDPLALVRVAGTKAGYISDVLLSADGEQVITAGKDGWLRRFGRKTREPVSAERAHDGWINQIALSADGNILASVSDDYTTKLWDAATGRLRQKIHLGAQAGALEFSPDGKLLTVGGDGGQLFLPALWDLATQSGTALFEQATASTGRHIVGFDLEPLEQQELAQEAPEPDAGAPGPSEVRGRVRDFFAPDKTVPEGATIELLSEPREQPFSPPVVTQTDPGGHFSLLLPDGVDRYSVRITAGKDTTYTHSWRYRRGESRTSYTLVPMAQMASLARAVSIELEPDKGQVRGMVWWLADDDPDRAEPMGCVEVTVSSGAPVFYSAPRPDSRVHPVTSLKVQHQGAPFFFLYNLEPGPHTIVARVGEHQVEVTLQAHAGAGTFVPVVFSSKRFPTNPTPPRCLENWPPKDHEATAAE